MNRPALPDEFPLRLQDLPAQDARFCIETQQFIERLGAELAGKTILLGCSGGADSLALLLVLRWLAPIMKFDLHAAHVCHGLRPEAEGEAVALSGLCRRLGVPFHRHDANILARARIKGEGVEEAGRNARYAFFAELRKKLGAAWVCTGHQRDDLQEDILMRLTRGAAWPGLSGMPALCPHRRILRPFLLRSRADIEHFLKRLGALPVEDASNECLDYLRNRIRHSVLPLLLEENPNLGENAATLWTIGTADAEYWTAQAEALLPGLPDAAAQTGEAHIPAELKKQPLALRLRLYMYALRQLMLESGLRAQPLAVTLLALDAAFAERVADRPKIFDFPGDIEAVLNAGGIIFRKKDPLRANRKDVPAQGKTEKTVDPAPDWV